MYGIQFAYVYAQFHSWGAEKCWQISLFESSLSFFSVLCSNLARMFCRCHSSEVSALSPVEVAEVCVGILVSTNLSAQVQGPCPHRVWCCWSVIPGAPLYCAGEDSYASNRSVTVVYHCEDMPSQVFNDSSDQFIGLFL